ncbi:hypothetical protein HPB47_008220 [Ixodes persulcatus]|uniref:Uncharacterized protein n=1 Tax=Ixodes persulcatus TaxID=34615 RepID=A0AC60P5A6_IXOPE|nr:hypothetical protein HPB47_008220 [Ixodes persulcatus]
MDRLRRTRGVVRSAVTRTISQLDGLIQNPNTTELDLRLPLDYLIQKQTSLADLDRDILTSTTDDDLENEIEGAEDYRTGISHGITRLRYALDKLSQPTIIATSVASTPTDTLQHSGHPPTTETLSSLPPTGTVLTAPAHGSHRRVALPKLQVPTFAGNISDWQGFWDHFDVTIHQNPDLPPIENFKYLMTYLTHNAKRAVEGIRLSEQNYDLAVRTLHDRFGRRDILIDEHINQLLNLPKISSSRNVTQLRQLFDAIRFRTTSLEGLNVPPNNYAVVLHRVLMRALPEDLALMYRQKIKESATTDSPNALEWHPDDQVKLIMTFLQIQIEIREEGSVGHKTIYAQDCTPTKLPAATKDDVSEEPLNQLKGPVAAREKERTTMPLSEPLSLYNNIVLGESGTHSFISTEDACDRRVDRSASKKRKPLHRKLLLPRRSEPLQSNVATEDFMHVRPSSENMELGADEEVKTCSVRETQRDEKQILHESAQTFGDAVSKTATQNERIAKTLAEEQPIGPEKDRHLLGTVQQSRFVHNKLKMRPAAAGNSDGEHQIFLPNGMSGLAEIVCSAQPGNFEHGKLSQGSKPSETEVTTDASASREQLHMSRATEGWSEKPDSACVKESSTLKFCHSEFEGEGSYRSEGTL